MKSLNSSTENKNENNKKNIDESLITKIKDDKNMLDKIGYLQLWWKTIFQIIKIQKYLRGFLYRVKLLRLLELKEKIVYGNILLSKLMKKKMFKVIIKSIKDKIFQKKKYYFNIWNSLILKKAIIKKLIKFDKKKIVLIKVEKTKNKKKIKAESTKKRDLHKDNKKSSKKEQLGQLGQESKKYGLESSRVNTERNIHNSLGFKNNSTERRSKQNIINNKNKKPCKVYPTSSNLLMNKSHNQIKNNKFNSKKNFDYKSNQMKLSKKNTNTQKYNKQINKNRNKKVDPSLYDLNMNKFKSYSIESSKNKIKNNLAKNKKKNAQLEYISTHENRFQCPRHLYYLNRNNLKKSPSTKIEKLDSSFQKDVNIDNNDIKKDQSYRNLRSRSLEGRPKKKFKSFVKDFKESINKEIKNVVNFDKNKCIEILKKDENKSIMKSKTKVMKKKKKKKSKKTTAKNTNKIDNKTLNKEALPWFNIWRIKNVKKKIINKLRCISILINKIKLLFYKENGNLLIKSLQKLQKNKIILDNFNIYRNIIFKKIILEKIKEEYKNKENNIENDKEKNIENYKDNKENEKENNKDIINKYEQKDNNVKKDTKNNDESFNNINEKRINIIEISPYQDTKINSKIKNNKMKIESKIKLQKLLIIRQNIIENYIKRKYFIKWKEFLYKYNPNLKPGNDKIKYFYINYSKTNNNEIENENENNHKRINSSYHRKRVKYQPHNNLEVSFNEDKLYSKKIVNYTNNNITSKKEEEYLGKSQPIISNYYKPNNFTEYNKSPFKSNFSNLITSSQNDDFNNININYNYSQNNSIYPGVYKRKKIIINNKNKISNNMSCIIGEINKSNLEFNNTMENEREHLNNSMVMRRRMRNNPNAIYFPKHVDPNLGEIETDYEKPRVYIREQPEFYSKNKNYNTNAAYQKMNIRYQKMYYENDLNSEYRQMNNGILDEQTNEGTN